MDIQTNRLYIREILPEDWRNLKNIAVDFRKSEYVLYDMPLPVEENEIKALTQRFADSHLFFAVFLKDSADMIGYVCFHNDNGNYDLGYCFHSAYQGNGYAFESCSVLMAYLERENRTVNFTAGTALKNLPSCKLLEKLGFVLKGTERLAFHKDADGNDIVFEGGIFEKRR